MQEVWSAATHSWPSQVLSPLGQRSCWLLLGALKAEGASRSHGQEKTAVSIPPQAEHRKNV